MFAILTNFVIITLDASKKHLTNQGQGSFLVFKYFKTYNCMYTVYNIHRSILLCIHKC